MGRPSVAHGRLSVALLDIEGYTGPAGPERSSAPVLDSHYELISLASPRSRSSLTACAMRVVICA
jgi:hypothetical protein